MKQGRMPPGEELCTTLPSSLGLNPTVRRTPRKSLPRNVLLKTHVGRTRAHPGKRNCLHQQKERCTISSTDLQLRQATFHRAKPASSNPRPCARTAHLRQVQRILHDRNLRLLLQPHMQELHPPKTMLCQRLWGTSNTGTTLVRNQHSPITSGRTRAISRLSHGNGR